MLNVFLVIIAYILVGLFEAPGLIRNKYWRELSIVAVLLSSSLTLSLLLAMGVRLPMIIPVIYRAFVPLLTWLGIM
ncbi:MAG TPA: hypothetical protein DDZ66_08880 [Firmicutes bacterium]|jgi:hypothetical protein|nr:hypothetical protein [Bacillota bacterium]